MMLRPLTPWKDLDEAPFSVTHHHGTGRSCARKIALGCTFTVVALHDQNDDQYMNSFKGPRL